MQIINPQGDLCQIQQLIPLPNGVFITDTIPLEGRICGIPGEYEIKLFYGDYTKSTTFSLSSDSYSQINSESTYWFSPRTSFKSCTNNFRYI